MFAGRRTFTSILSAWNEKSKHLISKGTKHKLGDNQGHYVDVTKASMCEPGQALHHSRKVAKILRDVKKSGAETVNSVRNCIDERSKSIKNGSIEA